MDSANKQTESQRVKKPTPQRVQNSILDQEQVTNSRPPASGRSISELPTGPGTRAMRQAAVIQMQKTHGNAHVMRQLQPSIQRQEEEGATTDQAGPSSISGTGGQVDASGAGVNVSGPMVNITSSALLAHSAFSRFDGILQAGTIIADNVVASNYTPGVGNTM